MNPTINLKFRVLALVALIFIVVSTIYVTVQIQEYDRDIQWAINREEKSLDATINLLEKHLEDHYSLSLKSIVHSNSIISAFAKQDRKLLYTTTLPEYLKLKLENDTDLNMHFHLPDGTSFLRMHKPGQHGDDLKKIRPCIQEVHNRQAPVTAYEIGRRGCYFRIAEPLFLDDTYIGAVEVGIPVRTIANKIQQQLQVETSLFFKNEKWSKVSNKDLRTHPVGSYTVLLPDDRDECLLPPNAKLERDGHANITFEDTIKVAHSLPIFRDYQDNIIGGIIACQDITPFIERKKHFVRSTLSLMLILFLSFMGVLYFTLGRLMDRLETYQEKQKKLLNSLEREISERKRSEKERTSLQAQLLQAQKMEALGLLSGGVAHDFNNLLTSIMGYTQLILTNRQLDEVTKKQLYSISSAGEKAANLIRQLLAFSRNQPIEMKPIKLTAIIQDLSKMIHRLLGEDIELILDINEEHSLIMGDQTQVEQILMNLAINARDAMPKGGLLTIASKSMTLEKGIRCAFSDVSPGTYIMLAVSDTGFGIDSEIMDRIFEPFFTTKGDKGTGLGLATVFGIVSQHNGHVCVESEIGKGTTFKIAFPAYLRRKDERKKPITHKIQKGSETILVVEDEAPTQEVIKDILESLGYRVFMAQNSHEAEAIFENNLESIQLVLTDMILPDINGYELFQRLKERNLNLKVVYMSGYSEEILEKSGVDASKVQFLRKPLTISHVATAVRQAIDQE